MKQAFSDLKLFTVVSMNDYHLQMGGDFVLSKEGRLVMFYPQKSAADRPSNEFILQSIQEAVQCPY